MVCKGINCEPEFAGHYYPRNSPHSSYNAVQLIHNASYHQHRRSALARHRRNRTAWGRLYTLCDAEQARHPGNGLCHLPWWRRLHNHSKSADRPRLLGAWRKCLSHIFLCCWQWLIPRYCSSVREQTVKEPTWVTPNIVTAQTMRDMFCL